MSCLESRGKVFPRDFDLLDLIEILATGRGGATRHFQVMKRGILIQMLT